MPIYTCHVLEVAVVHVRPLTVGAVEVRELLADGHVRALHEPRFVSGIDMTPEMLAKSRETACTMGVRHVEFREGLAESVPVDDGWADTVISNGVINLCADKRAVFEEIRRLLRPGGMLQFADVAKMTGGHMTGAMMWGDPDRCATPASGGWRPLPRRPAPQRTPRRGPTRWSGR